MGHPSYKADLPDNCWSLVGLNRPGINALSEMQWRYMRISYGRGGVPDTMPALEIMYQYAQGAQKSLTATKKKKIIIGAFFKLFLFFWCRTHFSLFWDL